MECKTFQNELPELILTPGAQPSLAAQVHLKDCSPCTEEFLSFQRTFALLDTWSAPEPTPYFAQKLQVRLREEQAAPKMSWFESLKTRLLLNTGHQFRPAVAGALALALAIGGASSFAGFHSAPAPESSATVNDLQILDRNTQAFEQLDQLEEVQPAPGPDQAPDRTSPEDSPVAPPVS